MTLPELKDWQANSKALHHAAMIYGPLHHAVRDFQNNYLHLATEIHPSGLSSGTYPHGGKLNLNFKEGAMIYHRPNGDRVAFPLNQHTQESLFHAVLDLMKADELADFFVGVEGDSLVEGLVRKITSAESASVFLALDEVTHQDNMTHNGQVASDFAGVLYEMFTAVARFRARLNGHMTPIVCWPEHFDLSTMWFKDADMDEHKAHMNFGFAPFSTGFDLPYLYIYIYPYPEDFELPTLPQPASWHQDGWRGVVVRYEDIMRQDDPALFVETMCANIFDILLPYLS